LINGGLSRADADIALVPVYISLQSSELRTLSSFLVSFRLYYTGIRTSATDRTDLEASYPKTVTTNVLMRLDSQIVDLTAEKPELQSMSIDQYPPMLEGVLPFPVGYKSLPVEDAIDGHEL
jgi:hypothetical protein